MALAVADNDYRAKAEAPATFDNLRNTIDLDDTLFELKLFGVDTSACHNTSTLQVTWRRSQVLNLATYDV
jgi:hypothetical protein